jgi:AcrR family transcriptional regulator
MVERNRELVLAAARRVFIDKGYAGATLEAIAEEAGFSRGVMYSQFESKADLFLTLLYRRADELQDKTEGAIAGKAGGAAVRALLEAGAEDAVSEAAWRRVLIEFRSVAARNPSLNTRFAATHSRNVQGLASVLDQLWAKNGLQPRFPTRVMAEFVLAVGSGLTLERAVNPGSLPFETLFQMVKSALGLTDPDDGIFAADTRDPLAAE